MRQALPAGLCGRACLFLLEAMRYTPEEHILSPDGLYELLAYYQPLLRLSDWSISIEFAHKSQLDNCLAEVTYAVNTRDAIIRLCSPETFSDNMGRPHDMEVSLVHELLHLQMMWIPGRDDLSRLEHQGLEQQLNALAEAIVCLKRSGANSGT